MSDTQPLSIDSLTLSTTVPIPLESQLKALADGLIPSDEFIGFGKQLLQKIFLCLKANSKYSLDRFKIAGSIGRKTPISIDLDFDLVVFVNHERPPFTNVLQEFKSHLENTLDVGVIKVTSHSLQFELENIAFDLLPALNYMSVTMSNGIRHRNLVEKQWDFALDQIIADWREGKQYAPNDYSSALCEMNLNFLAEQSPFTHQAIILAKFWNKTLHLDRYLSGRSALIEVIAIAAALQEQNKSRSLFQAFKGFLEYMARFDSLEIKFYHYYSMLRVPLEIKNQRPLVLDPVNPCNNLAWFQGKERMDAIRQFMSYAQVSLERLNKCKDLVSLFAVQSKSLVGGLSNSNWFVGIDHHKIISPQITIKMSKTDFANAGWATIVKKMEQAVLTTLACLTLSGKRISEVEIEETVKEQLALNILDNGKAIKWGKERSSDSDQHDIAIELPLPGHTDRCLVLHIDF